MKYLITICIAISALVAANYSYAQRGDGRDGAKKTTAVIVAKAVKKQFSDYIEALGTTKSNESIIVTADVSEKITAIYFDDGQRVKKGDLLATLNKAQEQAELRASEALTAERQDAFNRAKDLSENSVLPKATLQTRFAELKQSQAATEAIKASIENYKITAPFDGVLGLRSVSVGALVQPGDMITTLDDLSQIKIDFDIPSIYLTALQPNAAIKGYVEAFPARQFSGVVTTISPQVDPVTRTVRVRAVLPNDDGLLKPGLLMTLLVVNNQREAVLIPEEALLKTSDKNYVYLVASNDNSLKAKKVEITIGARQPGVVEVLNGLAEGERVIHHGVNKVRDGDVIRILAEETADETLSELIENTVEPH